MAETNSIDVFISSTCYDLVDLRAEVSQFLNERGMIVRVSEDPESAFYVEPHGDSIMSCLKNIEASRAVVAIIDRRYGPTLPEGTDYAGRSATHIEVEHAQSIGKPVFFFIREAAFIEYDRLRKDENFNARWIEKQNRDLWRKFLMDQFALPAHANRSNWFDQFKNSSDLKTLVFRRLVQQFPEYAGSQAMRGDRIVRMAFRFGGGLLQGGSVWRIEGTFENVGVGPALNIRHGIRHGEIVLSEMRQGGVPELGKVGGAYSLNAQPLQSYSLFCEYENRFGDGYRVEVPIGVFANPQPGQVADEHLLVRVGGRKDPTWQRVI